MTQKTQMSFREVEASLPKEFSRNQYVRTHNSVLTEREKRKHNPKVRTAKPRGAARVHKYVPQLGELETILPVLHQLMSVRGLSLPPHFMNRIENLIALFGALRESVSVAQMLNILFLYFKTEYSNSISVIASAYLKQVFGSMEAQAGPPPTWLQLFRDLTTNWKLVCCNDGFSKLSNLLSLCVSLGLCEAAAINVSLHGIQLFSVGAVSKHATALDLADALISTITYFVEGGYACFERGSVAPLLYGNVEIEQFEDEFKRCMRCQDYVRSGNLMKIEKMSDNDYLALLRRTSEKCALVIKTCKSPVEKNIFRRKMDMLTSWEATFMQTRVQGGLRIAPYSIGIFGGTGVGKSSVANTLMITTLRANGFSAANDRIISINESDKYMSNYRTDVEGVFLDDIGNTKADFVSTAPTHLVVQLVNNAKSYANMAEAEMKGKVSMEPKVVISTKNVKDACATTYSNEPASIARRDRITITVTVKDAYRTKDMLDSDKVRQQCPWLYDSPDFRIPDLWDIRVERAFPIPSPHKGGKATIGWECLRDTTGAEMQAISLVQLIKWVATDSATFFAQQEAMVAMQNSMGERLAMCQTCRLPIPDACSCQTPVPQQLSPQFGERVAHLIKSKASAFANSIIPSLTSSVDRSEDAIISFLLNRLDWLETSPYAQWTNWIPEAWITEEWCKNLIFFASETDLRSKIYTTYMSYASVLFFLVLFALFYCPLFILFIVFPIQGIAHTIEFEKKLWYDRVVAQNKCLPATFKHVRDNHIAWITGSCAILATLYGLVLVYRAMRVHVEPQGNLAPRSQAEIDERNAEQNPWAVPFAKALPCSERAKTTKAPDLCTLVFNNLCYTIMSMQVDDELKQFDCNCFFVKSNVALFPKHMWKANTIAVRFIRHAPEKLGGNFACVISREQSVDIPGTDFSLVWVAAGGDWKDLSDYLPYQYITQSPGRLLFKRETGDLLYSELYMKPGECSTYMTFPGARYNLKFGTFKGLCMAAIIAETRAPHIAGFHLGGVEGKPSGCSGTLLHKQFVDALNALSMKNGVVLCASSGTLKTELYGVQFLESTEIHSKSPIGYLPMGSNLAFYGQVSGRAKYYSEVIETPISPLILKECGVGNSWGKPKFHIWEPWQASLSHSANPTMGVPGADLAWAVDDYQQHLLKLLEDFPELLHDTYPLSKVEVLCGRDGVRFIDRIPVNTSIGYPLSGPKSHYLTEPDRDNYPNVQAPLELDAIFWDEVERMEQIYVSGERAYAVFKACLKDEPTPLSKKKVRVFQAAPCALQLLIRKYFLPIARLISTFPLDSECAVGINAHGREWDEMARHMKQFGDDRILAGDYSKYDLRLPAQLMFAAFGILIRIARACGYSQRDELIMRGIATDVCYPLMAYNGDLIQHYGSNPSGHNMTVYINSICNSLLIRCAFHHVNQGQTSFRTVCAIQTYGDDVKGSVSQTIDNFNHITVAEYLAAFDIVFTMPDKTSDVIPFMLDSDADFLKRKNVYNPDLEIYTGALDEDSIFKSLHSVLASPHVTVEQQCMQNVDGALREWFFHGRKIYELRRSQMVKVTQAANISHGCEMLGKDYDFLTVEWRTRNP